jgi:hypothetical protein
MIYSGIKEFTSALCFTLHIYVHKLILLIFGLFNDTVISFVYEASNCRMISEQQIRKDMEGSRQGLIWGTIQAFDFRDWGKPVMTDVF